MSDGVQKLVGVLNRTIGLELGDDTESSARIANTQFRGMFRLKGHKNPKQVKALHAVIREVQLACLSNEHLKWSTDFSKVFFIKDGSYVHAWRLIVKANEYPIHEALSDLADIVEKAYGAAKPPEAEEGEVTLPGIYGKRERHINARPVRG